MTIFGISQSTGVERELKIERGSEGISLTLTDHVGKVERGWIIVPGDDLAAALVSPIAGGSTVAGIPQQPGEKKTLDIEVRRNEVLLAYRPGQADIAVGLDDLQDALEGVISHG